MAQSFAELGLDARLLRSLKKKGLTAPTAVQAEAVPRALEGKDIVARARTGSGKTLAYLLPALHRLLAIEGARERFQAIVLVPTSELVEQVREEAHTLALHCAAGLRVTALANEATDAARAFAIQNAGHLVVTTPGRLATAVRDGSLPPDHVATHLKVLILDEADLLLGYGHDDALHTIAPLVPRACQSVLMSATTSADVERLSKLVLNEPLQLDLTHLSAAPGGGGGGADAIEHFVAEVAREEKPLAVLALLKLHLVKKKVLLFVNDVDAAYRLRLLLEAFGLRAAVLFGGLPLNSRHHVIQQFNKDLFDYLIAADSPEKPAPTGAGAKAKRRRAAAAAADEAEFGVTRGVDFQGVRTVVNVDMPCGAAAYTHRVGRTGRAGAAGVAVSLVAPADAAVRDEVAASLQAKAAAADPTATDAAPALAPFRRLKAEHLSALRYRAQDVLGGLTKAVAREARAKDLRLEILNSSRLQSFFETHEADAYVLKHDKQLSKQPQRSRHLRHLPDYLKQGVAAAAPRGSARRGLKRKLKPQDDPLKGKVLFEKDPEEPTDLEKRALKAGRKQARKEGKQEVLAALPKRNVRKRR